MNKVNYKKNIQRAKEDTNSIMVMVMVLYFTSNSIFCLFCSYLTKLFCNF